MITETWQKFDWDKQTELERITITVDDSKATQIGNMAVGAFMRNECSTTRAMGSWQGPKNGKWETTVFKYVCGDEIIIRKCEQINGDNS